MIVGQLRFLRGRELIKKIRSTMILFLISNPESAVKKYAECTTYRGRPGPRWIFNVLGQPSYVYSLCSDHESKFPSRKKNVLSRKITVINALRVKVCNPLHDILRARCVLKLVVEF